jgi:prolyl oligopeptidase
MFKIIPFALLTFSINILNAQKTYEYPVAPKDSTKNVYFDSTIYDPYQWMENPTDPRLLTWLETQKKITTKQGHKQTNKDVLHAQLSSMYHDLKLERNEEYVKKETKTQNKYEFEYTPSENDRTPDLHYRKKGESNYRFLVKIKDFRNGKNDNVVITNTEINSKQTVIAVQMSHSGSDWRDTYFFNLESGKKLPDTLKNMRVGSQIIWHENGVYYDRYNEPKAGRSLLDRAKGQTVYYHKLGTSQSDDLKLFQNPDTTGTYDFTYFKKDSSKLFFHHFIKSKGKIYKAISYATLNEDKSFFLKNFLIYPNSDSINFNIEVLIGDTVFLKTTWKAPNGKIMLANINQLNKMVEFIPEYDSPLRSIDRLGKDKIACVYLNKGKYLVLIYDLKGKLLRSIDFPEGKKVDHFYEYDPDAKYTEFCVTSFFHPAIWYQLSLKDFTFKPSNTIWVPYDAKGIETRYVKYKSKDGTEIPMYITCLKSTKLDGKNPTLLYGYGGYGTSIEPDFDQSNALWLLHGGILAIPDIRGGGVAGSDWEKAGSRLKKQNTIDDFIAAAEYLIRENYTNPEKLAAGGASHGGLLVGAAITQRPGLFKAAIAEAGVYDMLRFEKYTAGAKSGNLNEFGTATKLEDFINLKSYSPMHNIKKGVIYPNILLITGDSDDRVPPLHSYKFLATLQEKGSPKALYEMYIMRGAGHSGALTREEFTDYLLFKYYFLFDQLDVRFW